MNTVASIREQFKTLKANGAFSDDGNLELINASFIADEDSIFGEVNHDWCQRELQWYLSESLYVKDIPAPVPKIWEQIASAEGKINSNYGYCIFSDKNGHQFDNAIEALLRDRNSRQAVMVYTRPSIHADSKEDGMRDFICTNTVQLIIRNNMLHYIVNMRSNDGVYGFKGDRFWQNWVFDRALKALQTRYPTLEKGLMYWNAASLHIYPRHFDLVK